MGSMPRGMLRAMSGGGGGDRPPDRWSPDETKDSAIRLYRYEKVEDGVVSKQLCSVRMLHFNGKGVAPEECPGGVVCEKCRKGSMLKAQGTDEAMEKARQLAPTTCPTFVVVPLDEPTRFRLYDARYTAFQGIMLEIAMAGGWRSASYPDAKAWEGAGEIGAIFDRNTEDGINKVCGPNGQDFVLTPKKKGKGISWSVRRLADGCAVLPFPEDSKVLNPEVVQARIKAAMEKRSMKEGD